MNKVPFYSANPAGAATVDGLPEGRFVVILNDADITLQWFNFDSNVNDFMTTSETLAAPGGRVLCPSSRLQVSGDTNIRIIPYEGAR